MNDWILLADGPGYTGLFSDVSTTFWSGVLRIAYAVVAAAPFLVAGALVTGMLRGMTGTDRVRRILGVGHWSGPFRAWAAGILLPVCSLGALPIARELRRAGVPSGTVLSFVLVAPVLNPVSVIYGLSHIEPVTLLYFGVGTFVVSVSIGAIWNRFVSDQHDDTSAPSETVPARSIHRLAVAGDTAVRCLSGAVFVDYGLALLAVGLLGAFLPHGVLQTGLTRDNPLAPAMMALVAIPAYVTPTDVMMHFGHIVRDGFSLGAAFALIILGAGANVGVANWLRRDYGRRPLMLFVALLMGSTLIIGATADQVVSRGNATAEDHTHAFDSFTRLSNVPAGQAGVKWVASEVMRSIRQNQASGTAEIYGLILLGLMVMSGLVLRRLGPRASTEHLMHEAPEQKAPNTSTWDPNLSHRQLMFAASLGMFALTVVGLYLFYPTVDNLIDDMAVIRVEVFDAVREEDKEELGRRVAQWRQHAEKMPTSVFIRGGTVTDSGREKLAEFLYGLATLQKEVAAGHFREAKMLRSYVDRLYRDCCDEFRP